jgi:DNA polymerase III subunit gamma/tau
VSLALYRTYRPARLADVVGQEHITAPLTRALENDRVHHAYLFSGPRGCGKTSTARIMARSLNCEKGPTPEPCGECQSCIDLAAGGAGSIDVIELDAASHGGVDDTRDLRERAMFAPASSRYKIYIIDEAHMVSTAGFNALLKLVEEPPEHVRFIFATTDPDKVLPTIRSRTHNYAFRLVGAKELQEHLARICDAEGITADPAALGLVARAGAGSVRDSLSILGQVIAGSGPEGITYSEVADQLGLTDAALLDATIDAIAARDGAALFAVVEKVVEAGHEPRRFVSDLLERLRDVIVVQSVPDAADRGLIDAPAAEIEQIVRQAGHLGPAEASRTAEIVSHALGEMKGATAPRLQLELMAARLLVPAADDSQVGTMARIEHLERAVAIGQVAAPAVSVTASSSAVAEPSVPEPETPPVPPPPISAVAPSSAPSSAPPAKPKKEVAAKKEPAKKSSAKKEPEQSDGGTSPAPDSLNIDGFITMWPAVMDALSGYTRVAWMAFSGSRPLSWSNGVLAVGLDSQGKATGVVNGGHDETLRSAVKDVLKVDARIDVVFAPDAVVGSATTSASGSTAQQPTVEVDTPSPDDANSDDVTGVELVMRELGATQIGEIEH